MQLQIRFFSESEERNADWGWLFPLLILGLLVRIGIGLWFPFLSHPDEVFQYHEQAFRVLNGFGVVPWEYVYGIRSWTIPIALAGLLGVAQFFGLDRPWEFTPFIAIVFCILSLSLPLGMYRLGQRILSEKGARIALLLGLVWWDIIFYAHKPMPGILAAYAIIWLVVLLYSRPTIRNLIVLGTLAGLVVVLRFQLLPVIGVLGLFVLWKLRWAAWPAFVAALCIIALAGLLDFITWGGFLFSFTENFRLNFQYDISSVFGVSSIGYYAKSLVSQSLGLSLLALPGIVILWRAAWPLFVAFFVGLTALHIPAHKEFRFIIWILPFVLISAAAFLAWLSENSAKHKLLLVSFYTVIAVCIVGIGILFVSFRDTRSLDMRAAFYHVARSDALSGLGVFTPDTPWWLTPGYSGIAHPVPIVFADWTGATELAQLPLAELSHLITQAGLKQVDGFQAKAQFGDFKIWVKDKPPHGLSFEEHRFHAPLPTEKLLTIEPRAAIWPRQ